MQRRAGLGLLVGICLLASGCGGAASAVGHGVLFVHTLRHDPRVYPIYRWQPGSGIERVGRASDAMIDPQWSPDGKLIAFAAIRGGWDEAEPYEIYEMRADGTHLTQLTSDTGSNEFGASDPRWSPDGTEIAFFRDLTNRPYARLDVLSLRTGRERTLPAVDTGPMAWGTAGIVYVGRRRIMLLSPAMRLSTALVPLRNSRVAALALSPRGELAVLEERTGQDEVVLYSAYGRQLGRFAVPLRGNRACGVAWSPDGSRLLLGGSGVWTVDLHGKHAKRLPFEPTLGESCTLSWR